ncbi:MAG: hypothetical protein Q8K72_14285, partial [Acidimicrobiales bacterium]|nr:hypothetical protein [Acidimicrobiales bacterium]
MVAEAQAVRERVLRDLASRRKRARQQVEKLNAGRERLLEAYAVVRTTVDDATSELHTALSDARLAADAAARRVDEEPEVTTEQLDAEIAAAVLADHPIAAPHAAEVDHDHEVDDDSPGPFSGEVPVVAVAPPPLDDLDLPHGGDPTIALPAERRSRIGRRRRGGFEGLPTGELIKVEPPAPDEGVRVLDDPSPPTVVADEPEPEPASEPPAAVAPNPEPVAQPEAEVEPDPDPDPAADATPEPEPEPEPTVAAKTDPEPAAAADGVATADDQEAESSVDDIFARLRGDTADADADADANATAEPEPAAEKLDPVVDQEPAETDAFAVRDAALDAIDKELARRVKRTLADEQNEVLDLLRRAKPTGVGDLLPGADDHAARWAATAAGSLEEAAEAGAAVVGATAGAIDDLADELARAFTAPLRDRIERSFSASDGNLDDVTDRVRALYREWKGVRLTDTCRHHTAAAYARGLYGGLPEAGAVHWALDPQGGTCPDCDDNVLGGTIVRG